MLGNIQRAKAKHKIKHTETSHTSKHLLNMLCPFIPLKTLTTKYSLSHPQTLSLPSVFSSFSLQKWDSVSQSVNPMTSLYLPQTRHLVQPTQNPTEPTTRISPPHQNQTRIRLLIVPAPLSAGPLRRLRLDPFSEKPTST